MSRRIQTTPHRSYPWSGIDTERRNTILLVGGIIVVVAFALLLAGYGYYNDKVAPNRETVLRVGDRSWSVDDLQRRTEHQIVRNGLDRSDPNKAIEDTLKQMRDEELIRRAGEATGYKLNEDDLLQGFRDRYGLQPGATRDLIAVSLRNELRSSPLGLDELEDIVRAQIIERRMNEKVKEALPAKVPHVNLGLIQLGTQSQALQLRQTIFEEKESFAVVAARESKHASKDKAGDLGWVPREALPKEVADVAFGRDDLFLSDVIENQAGFFIIAVRGHEDRELTDENKELIAQQKRSELLEKTTAATGVAIDLTQGQERRIALKVGALPSAAGA